MTAYVPSHRLPTPPDSPDSFSRSTTSPSFSSAVTPPRSKFEALYEVIELIGHGGYGSVVKARRRSDGYEVAVKLIDRRTLHSHRLIKVQFCGDDSVKGMKEYGKSIRMVPVEVYAIRRIVSDGVVSFVDLFEDESFFYLVRPSLEMQRFERRVIITTSYHRQWNTTDRAGLEVINRTRYGPSRSSKLD